VQSRENDRQSGHQKVLDTVLGDYEKSAVIQLMSLWGGVKVLSEKTGSDDNYLVIQGLQIRFQFRILTCHSKWTIFCFMKKKTGICIYEVQVKENYRQRGHKRVWGMVLSNYEEGSSGCKGKSMGFYTLWLSECDY